MSKTLKLRVSLLLLTGTLTAAAVGAGLPAQAAVNLHKGRYLGYIEPTGIDRKVAVTMDLYVVQPHDLTAFPELHADLKLSLGGPQSSEYVTESFVSTQYDFTNGVLSLDEPANDVALTAKVTPGDMTILDGQVFLRASALSGHIHLAEQRPAPTVGSDMAAPPEEVPPLAGQYTGSCNAIPAVLQIETTRDLASAAVTEDQVGLIGYAIHGRIGLYGKQGACAESHYCAARNYASGSYDFFRGRLLLDATNGVDECQITAATVSCRVHLGALASACTFTRSLAPTAAPRFYQRSEHVQATPAQMEQLPPLNPPANTALTGALQGDWTGYLHNETTNRYQAARLNVMAYSSTDNPHNENLVYVATSAVLYFGKAPSRDFYVQSFAPRSFYLTPGFTLEGPTADAFLQIVDWRQGFLRGVWYSRAFGRVGTVELVKGAALPPLAATAKVVPSVVGDYLGPKKPGMDQDSAWWLNLLVPSQQTQKVASTLAFQGQYQMVGGATARLAIDQGRYDFYSGVFGWTSSTGQMVTGKVADDGTALWLFWPGALKWGVLLEGNSDLYPYPRL